MIDVIEVEKKLRELVATTRTYQLKRMYRSLSKFPQLQPFIEVLGYSTVKEILKRELELRGALSRRYKRVRYF